MVVALQISTKAEQDRPFHTLFQEKMVVWPQYFNKVEQDSPFHTLFQDKMVVQPQDLNKTFPHDHCSNTTSGVTSLFSTSNTPNGMFSNLIVEELELESIRRSRHFSLHRGVEITSNPPLQSSSDVIREQQQTNYRNLQSQTSSKKFILGIQAQPMESMR